MCPLFFIFFSKLYPLDNYEKCFSSKKLFLFLRYSNFCISVFPNFLPVRHCFKNWSKINLKVYDVISCLNKNLIVHFFVMLGRKRGMTLKLCQLLGYYVRNIFIKKHAKNMNQKLVSDPFLILVNIEIQLLHARNSFKIFWKKIVKRL